MTYRVLGIAMTLVVMIFARDTYAVDENPYANNTPYYTPAPTTTAETENDSGSERPRESDGLVTDTDEADIFYLGRLGDVLRLGDADLVTIIARLINMLLGTMGVLFVSMIVLAGFRWLLSFGNDEKVTAAKKTIANAFIGLVLILMSYSIAQFVLAALGSATGFES